MYILKNKKIKKALLLFGIMGYLSIVLCFVSGNRDPFIQFISETVSFISPPILYVYGIIYLIDSMTEKKTNMIASIILCVLATTIFLLFYGLAIIAILVG